MKETHGTLQEVNKDFRIYHQNSTTKPHMRPLADDVAEASTVQSADVQIKF